MDLMHQQPNSFLVQLIFDFSLLESNEFLQPIDVRREHSYTNFFQLGPNLALPVGQRSNTTQCSQSGRW